MDIYYTGATEYNDAQIEKDKSLGGFKSSTLVPNDLLGNLFGEVSMYGLTDQLRETRALIIHNNSGNDLANLYIWLDKLEGSIGKFKLSAIGLTPNDNGEVFMEKIVNIRATPFSANFVEADGESNKKLLSANFVNDSYLGLWFQREISEDDKESLDCDALYKDFSADPKVEQVTKGGVDITLSWT